MSNPRLEILKGLRHEPCYKGGGLGNGLKVKCVAGTGDDFESAPRDRHRGLPAHRKRKDEVVFAVNDQRRCPDTPQLPAVIAPQPHRSHELAYC